MQSITIESFIPLRSVSVSSDYEFYTLHANRAERGSWMISLQ